MQNRGRPAFEPGPPCVSHAVSGFVKSSWAGLGWGLFMGSYEAAKLKGGEGAGGKAAYVMKAMAKNGLTFGCAVGTFYGLRCASENFRQRRDWVNACVAGGAAGALLSVPSRKLSITLTHVVVGAALMTAGELLQPADR
eukprot:jgi/Mesen1/3693/ME000202S02782